MSTRNKVLLGVMPAMVLPFFAALFYFVLFSGARQGWVIYVGTKIFILLWPVIALLLLEGERPNWRRINWTTHVRAIPLGVLSGLAISAVGLGLYELTPLGDYVRLHAGAIRQKVEELTLVGHYVLFAVWLSLLHSLLEEYYWRWFIFGRLTTVVKPSVAYLLASLAFASYHYVLLSRYFPAFGTLLFGTCVGFGGAFWCWLFQKQRSLIGCWVSHLLMDAAICYVGHELVFL